MKAVDSQFAAILQRPYRPSYIGFAEGVFSNYLEDFIQFAHPTYGNRASAIRYEDVHTETERVMRSLCDKAEIPFEPTLLEDTLGGRPFYMISSGNQRVNGVSPERAADLECKVLKSSDIALMEYLFGDVIEDLGYPLRTPKGVRGRIARTP